MALTPEKSSSLMDSIQSEVSTEASPMLRFLTQHARLLAVGIVLFIVAIGGFWIYEWQAGKQTVAEQQEFGRIVTAGKAEDRLKALEAYVQTAPSSMRNAAWFAIAEAAQAVKDYPKAYTAWEKIAGSDASMKVPGTFGMAQALIDQGKPKEALALLDGISSGLAKADALNVNNRIVLLAESLGDYKRAIAACDAVLGDPELAGQGGLWLQKKTALQQRLAAAK